MNISQVLQYIRPGSQWAIEDNDYNTLKWLDTNTEKPSYTEIKENWNVVQQQIISDKIREKRNRLLADTDWVYIKYSEMGMQIPEEWKIYRQALRDITDSPEFPYDVSFPEEPKST